MLFEVRNLFLKPLREADIIGIHTGDESAARQLSSFVQTGDKSTILTTDESKSRIVRGSLETNRL
jgi:hypothetical protein